MFEVFKQYLEKMMPRLTGEQLNLIRSACVIKKLRRREMLLREGEISRKIFVVKGLLRNYSVAENGYEYVMKFTDACGWTTDPESYNSQLPTNFNIDTIEPSEVIMFSREDFETLKQMIPALIAFSESVMTKNISLTQRRVLMNISASAEKKYLDFINSFPDIFNRVPLHMWLLISAYQEKRLQEYARALQLLRKNKDTTGFR